MNEGHTLDIGPPSNFVFDGTKKPFVLTIKITVILLSMLPELDNSYVKTRRKGRDYS